MSSQYRNPLSFTPQATDAAKSALKRIDNVLEQIREAVKDKDISPDNDSDLATDDVPKALQNFEAALLDDLSMPRAAASLFGLIKAAEKEFKRMSTDSDASLDLAGLQAISEAMQQMDKIFGIFYEVPQTEEERQLSEENDEVPEEVLRLVVQRTEAKEAKDWELADSLRARITTLGFAVKDVKGGEPIVSRAE
jgi:cysteinyl-tRNA synthetase